MFRPPAQYLANTSHPSHLHHLVLWLVQGLQHHYLRYTVGRLLSHSDSTPSQQHFVSECAKPHCFTKSYSAL